MTTTKCFAAALGLALLTARPATSQCLGDCNGDTEVSVAEIVGAVNRALGQCDLRTPTPVGDTCPFRLDEDTGGLWCVYAGSIRDRPVQHNPQCLSITRVAWKSDGSQLSVRIRTPRIHLTGSVTNTEVAAIDHWGLNAEAVTFPIEGVVELEGGTSVTLYFPDPEFIAEPGTEDACPVGFIDADFLAVMTDEEVLE